MKCFVCNTLMDIRSKEKPIKDVYKCKNCKHVYVDFKDNALEYHKTLYRLNNQGNRTNNEIKDGKFTEKFHAVRENIMVKRCNVIKNLKEECFSLLDIGAGGGSFLNMVKDNP
mgnify:CR=1 FL=1